MADSKSGSSGKIIGWFTAKEGVVTFTFFVILSVLSFAMVFSARQTEHAVRKADIIVQCTTPGTACYKLSQEAAQQRLKELKGATFCLVDTLTAYPVPEWKTQREALLASYAACLEAQSK